LEPADAPKVCEIYYRSVREVASAKYDAAQIEAWAPRVPDPERWLERFRSYDSFVADDDEGKVVGWIATTVDGYVDMLFCLPEAVGRGVASALYAAAEHAAVERGITRLTAKASLLAEPFFKRHGWVVDEREVVVVSGVAIPRAAMSKRLESA
jgi:putative acetyltransferase